MIRTYRQGAQRSTLGRPMGADTPLSQYAIVPRNEITPRSNTGRTMTLAKPPSWMANAKPCDDAEFARGKERDKKYDRDRMSESKATALCAGCPIMEQCLEMALKAEGDVTARNRYGVWGGTTPAMRVKVNAARKAEAAAETEKGEEAA